MKSPPAFLVTLGLYAALNGVLYVGQEIFKRDDVARAEAIERELDRLNGEIAQLETWLGAKAEESDAIDQLGARLDHVDEDFASRAAYERDLALFNDQVEAWNAGLPEINRASNQYDGLIATFNGLVEEYNNVAKTAYSRWWLLPIPVPRRAGQALRHVG